MTCPVSKKEVVVWLETKLCVQNVEERLHSDKHNLLNDIIRAYQRDIPFETMSIASRSLSERRVPTIDDICSNIMSLNGGVCIDLNYFMKVLLEAVGYNVCVIGGNYTADDMPFTHVMCLVRDLDEKGDMYLVDVGCGYPTFHAVPLDQLPYRYIECGLEIQYRKEGDTYYRQHRKGDLVTDDLPQVFDDDNWRIVFDFELTPRDYKFFYEPMKPFFCEGPFLEDLHLCRFPEPGDMMVAFKDNVLYYYNSEEPEKGLQKKNLPDHELESTIFKYFPNLCEEEVDKAMKHYRNVWPTKGSHKKNVESGLEIQYRKEGDTYYRLHRKTDEFVFDGLPILCSDENWCIMFDFELTPRNLTLFKETMKEEF